MMLSINELTDLYTKYGFEIGPSTNEYIVFISQKGYFQNAEIVFLDKKTDNANKDKESLESLGYSVRLRFYDSISAVHDALFSGFFNVNASNKRLINEYTRFCDIQKDKLIGNAYEYVTGSYYEEGIIQNQSVIDRIQTIFDSTEQQLVILEASAGFGKTCTSFEVVKSLVDTFPTRIPIMAELSKNRKASIFRYVLLSEIDQKFPTLSSDLVTYEMEEGRVFLIIDGFDELLSKSYLTLQEKSQNKDAQTMLDTIAQLFTPSAKTKVLLTTRKSSIFVGDDFDEWVNDHIPNCNVTRIQLAEPSIKDWIGIEKTEKLRQHGIELDNVLNPVLLSLLRSETIDEFDVKYTNNDAIVERYIKLLLNRERTRQSLPLDVPEQLNIMSKLSAQMVQYDISAEESEFIKAMLEDVLSDDLEKYLSRYDYAEDSIETKPSESEFLNKLSHHALLDRVSIQSNQIGFINEYIFGLMILSAIENNWLSPLELCGKYLDIAITASSTSSAEKRFNLYKLLAPSLEKETSQIRLNASIVLLKTISDRFSSEYFDGIVFNDGLSIIDNKTFSNCIFTNCIFKNCIINTDAFNTCQFYNCCFYDVKVIPGEEYNCQLVFLSCEGHTEFASNACRECITKNEPKNYERIVLEQFWKPGYETAEPRRAYQTLLKGISQSERISVSEAIVSLLKKGILYKQAHSIRLNFERIEEIREIIQR